MIDSLFDDAAIFPPGNAAMDEAVRSHLEYQRSWYAHSVGPLICSSDRLAELGQVLGHDVGGSLDITVTVPGGPPALPAALTNAQACRSTRLIGVEIPLNGAAPARVGELSGGLDQPVDVYVEVPLSELTSALAIAIGRCGLRIKLRTGGTQASAFPSEGLLAAALATIVAGGVAFKCTAGLHNAVRHRDPETGFEHHGFLNIALAVRELRRQAPHEEVQAVLADSDVDRIAAAIRELTESELAGVRSLFRSFGTCSVEEPLSDLLAMGLVRSW